MTDPEVNAAAQLAQGRARAAEDTLRQAEIRTAPAADKPCELHKYHAPRPIRTQYHHSKPVYLQNRVYGSIRYGADTWLCGTDHDSLHEVIDWLLGEGREPNPKPGRQVMAEAQRTVDWYRAAQKEIGE